jgi:hypothetical protein
MAIKFSVNLAYECFCIVIVILHSVIENCKRENSLEIKKEVSFACGSIARHNMRPKRLRVSEHCYSNTLIRSIKERINSFATPEILSCPAPHQLSQVLAVNCAFPVVKESDRTVPISTWQILLSTSAKQLAEPHAGLGHGEREEA